MEIVYPILSDPLIFNPLSCNFRHKDIILTMDVSLHNLLCGIIIIFITIIVIPGYHLHMHHRYDIVGSLPVNDYISGHVTSPYPDPLPVNHRSCD